MSPASGKPLLLYVAVVESFLGALLVQQNEEGKDHALYYLSKTMVGAELNYSPIEKICLALVFALYKLRHYHLTTSVHLISRDNLKYIMSRPSVQGYIAKWTILLLEFDIHYVPQCVIKGQAFIDFLAAHLVPDNSPLQMELPDENVMHVQIKKDWEMFFDGAFQGPTAAYETIQTSL